MTYRKFSAGPEQVVDQINSAVMFGPFPWSGLAVGGRTLIFTTPVATVTFPGALNALVTMPALISAIRAQVADLHIDVRASTNGPVAPSQIQRYLALYRDGGVALSAAGTANALLGLSASVPTTVKPPLARAGVRSISRVGAQEYEVVFSGPDSDYDNPNVDGSSSGSSDGVVVP